MRRLAWTFAARICDKHQIRLTRSNYEFFFILIAKIHYYSLRVPERPRTFVVKFYGRVNTVKVMSNQSVNLLGSQRRSIKRIFLNTRFQDRTLYNYRMYWRLYLPRWVFVTFTWPFWQTVFSPDGIFFRVIKRWENGVRCEQTSLLLINVCCVYYSYFIRRSTARSKTTKKSYVNWVCAAILYHFPRLHDHLSRLHRSWNLLLFLGLEKFWVVYVMDS